MHKGSDSYIQNGGSNVDAIFIESDDEAFSAARDLIDAARAVVHQRMKQVAEAFWKDRDDAIKAMRAEGINSYYISRTISVQVNRGTAQARWIDLHSYRGRKSSITACRTSKTRNYHLETIKSGTPECLHAAIEEAEQKLRVLRRQQYQLGRAKRHLRVKAEVSKAPIFSEEVIAWLNNTTPTSRAWE